MAAGLPLFNAADAGWHRPQIAGGTVPDAAMESDEMIGSAFRQLLIWLGLLGLLVFVANQVMVKPNPAAVPAGATGANAAGAGAAPNSLTFHANKQGHVLLDGNVNGAPVRFLVDTGATMVVLTMRDAAAAGLTRSDLNFTMRTSTANGVARAAPVQLREVRINQLSLTDVRAAVVENLNISLLGQSFLTRLDGYEMRDGVLTLTYW